MRRVMLPVTLLCAILSRGQSLAQETKVPRTAQDVRDLAAAGISFKGAPLARMDLSGIKCVGMDLAGTNWANADLRGARLTEVDLTGASMDEVNARGITFQSCTLLGVSMRRADLAGALFRACEMGGCDLSGSKLAGAQFDEATYSRGGGRYVDALALALAALTGPAAEGQGMTISRAMAAGLSTQAVAFVYNPADMLQLPTTPFTQHPLKAAVQALGHEVEALYDLPVSKALTTLTRALKAGRPCLLPVSLAGEEITGTDLAQPFWAAAVMLDEADKPGSVVLLVPPFGERRLSQVELTGRWEGPFETLEPAGTERSEARYPLLVLSKGMAPRAPREAILVGLRNAVDTITERRTYGTLNPGLAGLQRLADDFAAAAKAADPLVATSLAAWAGRPRSLLCGARLEAADFLEQAAGFLLPEERAAVTQAAALFRSEASLLANRFPPLGAAASSTADEVKAHCLTAAPLIREMAGLEAAAAALLLQVVTGVK